MLQPDCELKAPGGAEVDLIFEFTRLIFSRWQIQCKNTTSVSLDDVAKEVGLTHFLKNNVIVVVSMGAIGTEARRYSNKIMKDSNLAIVLLDKEDMKKITVNISALVDVFHREARHAMDLKTGVTTMLEKLTVRKSRSTGMPSIFYKTEIGQILHGDSLNLLKEMSEESVDLIVTSPPFGLVRKKEYGSVDADQYIDWFTKFAVEFHRILKNNGSLVIDIGGSWNAGLPTRSLYHFKLVVALCEELNFHLAQDLYWWNPSKLPTPAEWVTVRRIRVKDAVNTVWWLSKTTFPKSSNKRVLQPYSDSMHALMKNGYKAKKRPSGHDISDKFAMNNGGYIPPNLLAIPNTESNSNYIRYCADHDIKPHPARFPGELPEYFIRMLTDPGDLVLDPFAGSCVTGEVCERLNRRWICSELVAYLQGALGRFPVFHPSENQETVSYRISKPGYQWVEKTSGELPIDGGKKRQN